METNTCQNKRITNESLYMIYCTIFEKYQFKDCDKYPCLNTKHCYLSGTSLDYKNGVINYKNEINLNICYFIPMLLKQMKNIIYIDYIPDENNLEVKKKVYYVDETFSKEDIDNAIDNIFKSYNEYDIKYRKYLVYLNDKLYFSEKYFKEYAEIFEFGEPINIYNHDENDIQYIISETEKTKILEKCEMIDDEYYISYEMAQSRGYCYYAENQHKYLYRYISLNPSNTEFLDLDNKFIYPSFANNKPITNGKIKFNKNNIFIKENKKYELLKDGVIPNQYGKINSFAYYEQIYRENNEPIKILISTLEVLDYSNYCIYKIVPKIIENINNPN